MTSDLCECRRLGYDECICVKLGKDTWEYSSLGFFAPNQKDLISFLETYCEAEIFDLVLDYPTKKSIYIGFKDVLKYSLGLERAIIFKFDAITAILRLALAKVKMFEGCNKEIEPNDIVFRIRDMPVIYKKLIGELNWKEIGELVCVEGFAKFVTEAQPKMVNAAFKCLRCGHVTFEEQGTKCEEPYGGCGDETCGKKGPFKLITDDSVFVDFQQIHLQELPDSKESTQTHNITVECSDELTNKVAPGDRITVTLFVRQITLKDGKSTLFEKLIKAVSIEKPNSSFDDYDFSQEEEEEILKLSKDPDIRDKICRSIAPAIHGYEEVKEALALQLFSGVRKILPDGTTLRGSIHTALIGDPSTAKSQLLRRIVILSPKGIFTSGKTASAAGLTAAVVKDPYKDGWTLEGGAAVMASGGVLAIDEIGQATEEDKSALHEVMEQQTVSISKAGIVATLRATCSILAGGNPKQGYFDRYEPLPAQIEISPALWTRFDLIFTIFDTPNSNYDTAIANHILRNHRIGAMIQNRELLGDSEYSEKDVTQELADLKAPIATEKLQKYIAYARSHIVPVASKEEMELLIEFYTSIRIMKIAGQKAPVPITARALEAGLRLAEASAKMRLSNTICKEDIEFAKKLIFTGCLKTLLDCTFGS
jgi:replicative DNA helicase Mcm